MKHDRSIIALWLLVVLIGGLVPAAFAKGLQAHGDTNANVKGGGGGVAGGASDAGSDIVVRIPEHKERDQEGKNEKSQARLDQMKDKFAERLSSLKELGHREAFKQYRHPDARARIVAQDKIEESRKRFQESKEKEQEARKRFQDQKGVVKDLRAKAKDACKDTKNSDACKSAKADVVAKAKESLLHAADAALETLAKVQSKIAESEYLTDEEESALKAKVDARVQAIQDAKTKAQALGRDATTTDVEDQSKAIRKGISDAQLEVRVISQMLVNSRMGGVIITSKQLEARLSAIVEKAAEQGKDVAKVDTQVDAFHAQIEAAAQAHEEARAKLLAGDIQAGQAAMKKAKAALGKAHELVKAIFQALKAQGLDKELQAHDIEAQVKAEVSASGQASATA